ncbi:DUF4123 domain-containing protein [Buttiauxella brennerae]|uniref:DUF4123 domain-containing protein n=1 Tax=Buttiauxella brennerae TaxID=82988 RepID=UPI00286EC1C5|nr:DUF4123 domain-containing protein [Buttiauxella brennerae]
MDNKYFYKIKEEISNAAFGSNGQCFLLIDAALEQYQSSSFLYDLLKDYELYPITFHQNELQGALSLYLISLNVQERRDCELFNNSIYHALDELEFERINAGEGRSVCAWISTQLTREQLSESISQSAVQSVQSGVDVLIRYFDPSVFGLLLPVFDNWQKQKLLNNINVWCYIDGDGATQIVNGDGRCIKKLNYSLGVSEINLLEMNNIIVINSILREYRKIRTIENISEQQAAKLLHPALHYFHSRFSSADEGVIEFGLDILTAQRLFYQDGVFEQYLRNSPRGNLHSYSDLKSRVESQLWEKTIR